VTSDTPFADPDDEDSALRPAWEDAEDETDADRLGIARAPRPAATNRSSAPAAWLPTADLPVLLGPLCAATEALALAGLLRRPPKSTGGSTVAGATTAAEALAALGADGLNEENLSAW